MVFDRFKERVRVVKLMKAYEDGRKAILIGMYKVMFSILDGYLHEEFEEDVLKASIANVINRLTLRNENRPDPRDLNNKLSHHLKDLCNKTLIREATALIILLDINLGVYKNFDVAHEHVQDAIKLGGEKTEKIYQDINPATTTPEIVSFLTLSMAGLLSMIADGETVDGNKNPFDLIDR